MWPKLPVTAQTAREIFLTPASAREVAAEYGLKFDLVHNIRSRQSCRRVTRGLPRPPYVEYSTRPQCLKITTEPLRRKHKRIAAPRLTEEDRDEAARLRNILAKVLPRYVPRDVEVFKLRYEDGLPLDQIAKKVGVTRERIRQICAGIVRVLRWHMRHPSHEPLDEEVRGEIVRWCDEIQKEIKEKVAREQPDPEPEPEPRKRKAKPEKKLKCWEPRHPTWPEPPHVTGKKPAMSRDEKDMWDFVEGRGDWW